ncbi:MAG: hypothetical protein M1132_01605 [Chloroflexi bacterium]|nr:hypothetical protein [Chloroflexota bacterium]
MRYILALFILLGLAACQPPNLTGVAPGVVAPGHLEGHVTIGPLTPVERVGVPTPTVPPQVYAARQLVVYQGDGKTVVQRVKIDGEGNYAVSLAPGSYVVGLAPSGVDRARDLPADVTITSGMTVTLNVSIDTGIR